MKFTTAVFTALAVASVSASPKPATTSASVSPVQKCLLQCPSDDNWADCAAQCEGVPHPSSVDTEATRKCSAKCDQGDGSPADTRAYAACLAKCSNEYYFSSGSVAVPTAPAEQTSSDSTAVATTSSEATTGGSSSSKPTDSCKFPRPRIH
jgi:hypothetical protein